MDKRKDAVKKAIAAMTVGKDVSSLFTDVVNCMQTENLEHTVRDMFTFSDMFTSCNGCMVRRTTVFYRTEQSC
ncbi:unnamed protein product [Microthlaspi erraticum]|uniref:Uncharacterized protein n=1 Tax=Microthlaspi erraticum TaxID=1685480 RepID=A0A6D2KUN9_9BRAS|nr:unnamed protein product [Microthlaspi erraticum]CAA7056105.1 unnamed protein product [Microthlaspi erraticum]CAA7056108.1 unnamed protein product [Microthlaspi erraticum]